MKTKPVRARTKPQIYYKEKSSEQDNIGNRILKFANRVRIFVKRLKETTANIEDIKRIVNSSGSIGVNYIKANNASDKKGFIKQIRICYKKAEESRFWLGLLDTDWNYEHDNERKKLLHEATGLVNIFASILNDAK